MENCARCKLFDIVRPQFAPQDAKKAANISLSQNIGVNCVWKTSELSGCFIVGWRLAKCLASGA
jgi:hypothetical protein